MSFIIYQDGKFISAGNLDESKSYLTITEDYHSSGLWFEVGGNGYNTFSEIEVDLESISKIIDYLKQWVDFQEMKK